MKCFRESHDYLSIAFLEIAMARPTCTSLALLVALSAHLANGQRNGQRTVSWYAIRMGGVPVGWMRDLRTTSDSGITVNTDMRLTINRIGSQVVMEMTERAVEDRRGRFVLSDLVTRLSKQATELYARAERDSVRIRTAAGGREFARSLPVRSPLLGTAMVERLSTDSLRRLGDSIRFATFAATAGAPATVTRVLVGIDSVWAYGDRVGARRVIERSTASPMPITYWLDARGQVLRSSYDSPFGRTESELVDSATAVASSGGRLTDEQYTRTLVPTGIKLPQPRRLAMLRLVLSRKDTSLTWPDLTSEGQRVISATPDRLELEITRREPPPGPHPFPVPVAATTRDYLTPNAYIQSDVPSARALARRIIGHETDAWRATLALERWVADSMHFDLGVAFAPSTEVLERRRGTCVAYATLLATLARAAGIPSRVAFGFGYVNGMLGGHAWTEVFIGDVWVAADGALVGDGPADAARFAFTHASLAGGASDLTSNAGALLYGRIDARITAYQVSGRAVVELDSAAAPYVITGNNYRNATLGMAVAKPDEFSFVQLNEIWPSRTIVGMANATGDTVRITSLSRDPWITSDEDARTQTHSLVPRGRASRLTLGGGSAWLRAQPRRAAIAVPNAGETLAIVATGANARDLAERMARALVLSP